MNRKSQKVIQHSSSLVAGGCCIEIELEMTKWNLTWNEAERIVIFVKG